jgi:leader peptidase (prepilin peptidase)/N-methyltransferase
VQEFFQDPLSVNLAATLTDNNPASALPWIGSSMGAAIAAGALFLVGFTYQIVRKQQGLGMGDVKMMAMVGAFLGWRLAILTVIIGSFAGSIIGILLILFRGKTMQTKLAFGTFLGMGALLAVFFGPTLIRWYTATL